MTWHPAYYLRSRSPTVLAQIRDDLAKFVAEWVPTDQLHVADSLNAVDLTDRAVAVDLEWAADGRLLCGKFFCKRDGVPGIWTPEPVVQGVQALAEANVVVGHHVWGDLHRLIAASKEDEP